MLLVGQNATRKLTQLILAANCDVFIRGRNTYTFLDWCLGLMFTDFYLRMPVKIKTGYSWLR